MDATKTVKEVSASPEAKNRPIKSFWEDDVSVSIWARDRITGGEKLTFYSMTFQRRWLDDKEKAHYTPSGWF